MLSWSLSPKSAHLKRKTHLYLFSKNVERLEELITAKNIDFADEEMQSPLTYKEAIKVKSYMKCRSGHPLLTAHTCRMLSVVIGETEKSVDNT